MMPVDTYMRQASRHAYGHALQSSVEPSHAPRASNLDSDASLGTRVLRLLSRGVYGVREAIALARMED